jgi:hypothetical protein
MHDDEVPPYLMCADADKKTAISRAFDDQDATIANNILELLIKLDK